jgi:hypothetical protein
MSQHVGAGVNDEERQRALRQYDVLSEWVASDIATMERIKAALATVQPGDYETPEALFEAAGLPRDWAGWLAANPADVLDARVTELEEKAVALVAAGIPVRRLN